MAKVERTRVLSIENGIGALLEVVRGDLDHIEPAHSILVAAVDCLEGAIIWANDRLGGKAAHAEKHVQDVGEALGLAVIVGRALIQGPL